MPLAIVTGANRGLGLEHARQFAAAGWELVATARQPDASTALTELRQKHPQAVRVVRLDVADFDAVEEFAASLSSQAVDLLLNNAGSFGPQGAPAGMAYQGLAQMDYGIWRQILEVNLLAPFKLSVSLLDSLRLAKHPRLVMMSSDLGSIAQNLQGQSYAYRSSKAGLNIVTKGMAAELPDIIVVAMAPGWCKTDLGGVDAPITAADSVREQQACFARLTLADSGRFIDRFGANVPW